VSDTDARQSWDDLRDWVEDYARRFAVDSRTIPSCWYRHNPMVEALVALRDHEQASYEYSTSKSTAVEFIRATREIGVVLRELAGRSGCSAGHHRPEPSRSRGDDVDWAAHVAADEEARSALQPDESDEIR
jgi:hypothetical protein